MTNPWSGTLVKHGGRASLRGLQRIESFRASAGRIVVEYLFQGNTEDVRNAEGNFERRRVLITFNGIDGLTRNEDTVSEFLLGHGAGAAEFTNGIADSKTHCLPAPSFVSIDKSSRHLMQRPRHSTKEICHADIR
jgi:hypothetical protein